MQIIVTLYAKDYPVEVEPSTTIQELKEKINEANGTPIENIHLYLSSHPIVDGVISDYEGIKEGSKLSVRIKFPNKEGEKEKEKEKCSVM